MTLTVRERVLAALYTVITNIDEDPLFVSRNRAEATGSDLPALIMYDGDHNTDYSDSVSKRHTMNVMVDGYVSGDSGELAGKAANALYGELVAAVMADDQLGGLVQEIRELQTSFQPIFDGGEKSQFEFQTVFEVTFYTQHSDPFASAP